MLEREERGVGGTSGGSSEQGGRTADESQQWPSVFVHVGVYAAQLAGVPGPKQSPAIFS